MKLNVPVRKCYGSDCLLSLCPARDMGENNHMQLLITYFLSVFGTWPQAYEGHYVNPWLNAKSLISWFFFFFWGLSHATVCVLQAICRSQGDNLSVPRSFQICRLLIKAEDDVDISLSNSCRNIHSQIYHYKNHVCFLVSPGGQCTIHIHAVQTKRMIYVLYNVSLPLYYSSSLFIKRTICALCCQCPDACIRAISMNWQSAVNMHNK